MRTVAAGLAMLLIAGCGTKMPSTDNPALAPPPSATKEDLEEVQRRLDYLESLDQTNTTLKLGDSGFSILDAGTVRLTIQLMSVRPQGSGSILTLRFGNPSSATIAELELASQWGNVDPSGEPIYKGSGRGTLKISQKIPPASWVTRNVTIDGTPPDKLGFVRINSATVKNIELYIR
ncbi:DUF3251 domain-containing protein [Rhizorhabdus wittichii]|uniref:DUF3251 domain-containing protein n=1 Tax=Rhizorhabdus wittichii TaxID=160791 RepID=A0A975D816_9SPHN|nr:DUF3251 domain-containing protein [Rhizorhabdus wittichii]QTH23440.1 DUF3251 domain-containing protein [Rhizorhabdus wittichii]